MPEDALPALIDRLRPLCLDLPDAYEELGWVGVRWAVRKRTFAHVLTIEDGRPPSYATAARTDGPCAVVTLRASATDVAAYANLGDPYFTADWGRGVVGLKLGADTDWDEVAEMVTESYCVMAPRRLADAVLSVRR
jgi:YjbR protein